MTYTLHLGDCRNVLATLDDNSVDSIVTDPPYELGFMNKAWDNSGIAYDATVWTECLRVLKPGGHLLAFGGSRTFHRMAVAIEDAGFDIRDQIMWIYGSGFPKSLNIGKAMDKQGGIWRGRRGAMLSKSGSMGQPNYERNSMEPPATDNAKQWDGWGTALKPAHEPICVARKPLIGTVVNNVLTYGVGGINIDGCRIPSNDGFENQWDKLVRTNICTPGKAYGTGKSFENGTHAVDISANKPTGGRWPANIIFDEAAGQILDEQGGASRFFYTTKTSKSEREAGLSPCDDVRHNHHPTVKPLDLMQYLVRLVTPKGGTVLDPFMGSGSTGCAAVLEGFDFVGIDITPEYIDIATKRLVYYSCRSPLDGV